MSRFQRPARPRRASVGTSGVPRREWSCDRVLALQIYLQGRKQVSRTYAKLILYFISFICCLELNFLGHYLSRYCIFVLYLCLSESDLTYYQVGIHVESF